MKTELLAVMKKELRQIFRDRRMSMVLVMAPVLQLTLLGYAVDLDVDRIPTAIVDHDDSPASRALIRGLMADGTLIPVPGISDAERAIEVGDAQAAIIFPPKLGADLEHGRSSHVQILINGTDPIRAQAALDAAMTFFQQESIAIATTRFESYSAATGQVTSLPRINVAPRILYNPQMKSSMYMVPGVAAMVLLVVTTISTAMNIAKERELGTIEQLLVTPMQPATLLLGKVLPFAGIGMVVAGLVIAVGTNLFAVPVRGPLWFLFLGAAVYLISTLGVGVFISTVAKTQQQAILGGIFFIMPAIYLSGFMSPVENMPEWIKPLTWFNPVRYFVEILRAVLLKGAGPLELWPQLLKLSLFGATIFTIASLRFRKRLA
jgi:ABC-2 type transport system permease protein